ncbi:MAG: TonB-dependent receptor, partial [candidate division KSB1 bacterium]|nr:TonB-dependent receptor [candidate division KSB1 bacterium]
MKKAIITLLIIWGMMSGLHAGTTGKLAGIVTDKNNGEPLVGVNIVIKGTTMGAASGMDGQYFIVNIPVGVYVVDATMIGYKKQSIANVVIAADLTTKIDFKLIEEPIAAGEEVVVVAERPLIQKDLTASIDITDAGQVRTLPVTNYKQVVDLQTGIVVVPIRLDMAGPYGQFDSTPDDGIHSRGGRTNETAYLLNGIAVKDPLWGAFFIDDLPILGLNQLVTYKGTYLAEYGEGMSAVMNMVSEPNLKQPTFNYTTFTDRLDFVNLEKMNTYNHELVYQGTIPQTKDKLTSNLAVKYNTTDGRFWGYIYPNYRDSEGYDKSGTPKKVPMNYDDYWSTMGSLRFFPSKNLSLLVGGVATDRRTSFYNHYFKYNPYGNPRVRRNYWLGYLQSKHVLSNKYFYELSLSRYDLNFKSNIFDDLKTSLIEKHVESPER